MKAIWFFTCITLAMLMVAGCGKKYRSSLDKPVDYSKQIPKTPPARNVPLDPALKARALTTLNEFSKSPEVVLRAHAVEALGRSMKAGAKDAILAAAQDAEPRVRFAALMAAGEIRLPEIHDVALKAVKDVDVNVRIAARFALHMTGDTSYSHDFEDLSRNLEPEVRGGTALALGLMHEPSASKVLTPMLVDRDPLVRYQAAESLWRLDENHDALNMLVAGTLSTYPDDQMQCLLALAAPGRRAIIGHVRNGLTTDYEQVNLVAARAMGQLGSDEGYGLAMKAVSSDDKGIRLLSALAFGAIGRADSQKYLETLLADTDASVRLAAAEAILDLQNQPG